MNNRKMIPRIMPCLLLKDGALVKTVQFKNPAYIGDPINAIKIYNEKEVDELIFLDIDASMENRKPSFNIIRHISTECFMPLCYGGGINSVDDMKEIFNIGVEKVSLNNAAIENHKIVEEGAKIFGSQSIVVSMDVKKNIWGKHEVFARKGTKNTKIPAVEFARKMEDLGAGELLVTSIDHEGTWIGYDLDLLKKITSAVTIPVIANGGAGSINDFADAVKIGGASALSTGSMVVYQKKDMGVLINFPLRHNLNQLF